MIVAMVKLFFIKIFRNGKIRILCVLIILISLSGIFYKTNIVQSNKTKISEFQNLRLSSETTHTTQWLQNPSFDSLVEPWYYDTDGDISDVYPVFSDNVANIQVLGTKGTFSLTENSPENSSWTTRINPDLPAFPVWVDEGSHGLDNDGFFARHQWEEGPIQNPSIQWIHEIEVDTNMSDYIITSANVSGIVSAAVDRNIDVNQSLGDIPEGTNSVNPQGVVYDYIRYYIKIADSDLENEYEIAYYKTTYLGLWIDGLGGVLNIENISMITISEETLKFYLTSVLFKNSTNFSVIVGIDIFCEDNCRTDEDTWDIIHINSLKLSFTFEKKIDQFTTVSLNQDSGRICDISNYSVKVKDAKLNFKYKIDQKWPDSSPNSELRIFINNVRVPETIKLIEYNCSPLFQDVQLGGFGVKSLISEKENISISIQLCLADEFELDQIIIISIDDIFLEISYIELIPTVSFSFLLFWIVIIILLVIVSILSVLSIRSYYFIPHKKKKTANLLLRTQKFKDAENMQGILLIHTESGLPIFTKNYSNLMEGKKTLFSGFIQAISVVSDEIYYKKTRKVKSDELDKAFNPKNIVELDFKHFFCLILDIEEIRAVLILKHKTSKRLKQKLFNFTLDVYLRNLEILKEWDHTLDFFKVEIPPLLNTHFDLYYKDFFKIAIEKSDLQNIRKEINISKQEYRIINNLFQISQEDGIFKLMTLLEKISDKNEDTVIDVIEALINHKLIIPVN